jgi:hypothetical protein
MERRVKTYALVYKGRTIVKDFSATNEAPACASYGQDGTIGLHDALSLVNEWNRQACLLGEPQFCYFV